MMHGMLVRKPVPRQLVPQEHRQLMLHGMLVPRQLVLQLHGMLVPRQLVLQVVRISTRWGER